MRLNKELKGLDFLKYHFPLLGALVLSFPVLFWNALRYSAPMGYAGMFSLMAELIANASFRLPLEVPYYGPGGIPFAYPPLGLYAFALLITITKKTFILLRFLPPFLTLTALIPYYFLVLEISRSRVAGFAATFLAGISIPLHIPHAWAAGIVRAPAFFLSLCAIVFFILGEKSEKTRWTILSGITFGATILTHLHYALFVAIWIFFWSLSRFWSPKTWLKLLQVGLIGFLTAAPWIALMLYRYSFSVFFGAIHSHGNLVPVYSIQIVHRLISQAGFNLQPVWDDKVLSFFAVIGLARQVIKRNLSLLFTVAGLLLLIGEDGQRFIFTMTYLLAGIGISQAVSILLGASEEAYQIGLGLVIMIGLGLILYSENLSIKYLNRFSPRLTRDAFLLADFFHKNTATESTYLALVPQDEAEWMPYLFRRSPLVAQWGSEWLGAYDLQTSYMLQLRSCRDRQDFVCIERFFARLERTPDYLVLLNQDKQLNAVVAGEKEWQKIYQNSRYTLWQRK